mgnify:FL=1
MDTGAPRARSVRGMSDFTPHTGSCESPSVTYPDGSTLGVEVDGAQVHLVARGDVHDLIRDTNLSPAEAHHLGEALVEASAGAGAPEPPRRHDPAEIDALLDQFALDEPA